MRADEIANLFLEKDDKNELFNKDLKLKNGRTFYEGNARLNKLLHLTQNIYIAKNGCPLIDDDFYAYDNGAVLPMIQQNYSVLLNNKREPKELPVDIEMFLEKIFLLFKNAPIDDLIELSHEDPEWVKKHSFFDKESPKMDSMAFAEEYKKQYADIIEVMDRI